MKKLLLILCLAVSAMATAQKFSIKGQLVDSLSNPLPAATVMLLNPKDSSLVNFGVANAQGNFEIKNVSKGEHLFKVSFIGFRSFTQKIVTPETAQVIELGLIRLEPASNELQAVEFTADKAPVTVKHDTIEFNAGSFKTKQNAVVEDLLKKLPGVEVDNDGNITAQGETVRRVTVDGKNFFGSDPKVATKNLPADAIDKVQVFDKKSDQAAFTGIDDGQREKTINLELKEEKRNGAFGTILAGLGTDERFQGRTNLNRFGKGKQLSFLGMANNVNEQGFSMEDYMNFTGGSSQLMGGGGGGMRITLGGDNSSGVPLNFGNRANGIMTNYAGGINMNNEFNKKTELNGSYFYNYLDHDRNQSTFRENFLPADASGNKQSFTYNQNSNQQNSNSNHRLNLTLDHKLDSANSLKLTANVTYNETDSEVISESQSYGADNVLLNENHRLSLSYGSTANLNSTLLWRHKFSKKGRNLTATLQFGASENDRTGFLDAVTTIYSPTQRDTISRQNSEQYTLNKSYGGTVSYTEPLGGRKYLEFNYSFRKNLNDVERKVYNVNDDVQEFDPRLSNLYNSDYEYHRAGVNFKLNRSKYSLTTGASIQQTYLQGYLEIQDIEINPPKYQNFLPVLRFNYDFSTAKHFRFDYETSVQEPSIQQLQPVIDNSDPLNLYVGNPALRPAYSQSWRMNFNTFNPMNFLSFFAFVDVDYTTNAITNARSYDQGTISTTTPVNVDNNMSVATNATVSFPINKIKSRLSIGGNFRNQHSINIVNDLPTEIDQQSAGGRLTYSYRYKETFDFNLSARLDRQITDYEFNQDQIFLNNTYTAEGNLTVLKNYQLSSTFEFLQYENKNNNFNQSIPLLNISVSRYLLKNNSGELKFSVNNLFDKALGINQTASLNYFERQTTNSLGRYLMVSFIYSLNKQLNPMGMRRGGGGGIRIMR
jgi:hypothetical protein